MYGKFSQEFRKRFETSDRALLIFTFTLSLVISLLVIYQRESAIGELYESRFINSASDLKRHLSMPLKINNIVGINDVLKASFLTEESLFVKVFDSNQQVVYDYPQGAGSICPGIEKTQNVEFENEKVGTLAFCFKRPDVFLLKTLVVGMSGFIASWMLLFILIGIWFRRRTEVFARFFGFVDNLGLAGGTIEIPRLNDGKVQEAANKIAELVRRFRQKQEEVTRLETAQEYARLASQVSHDIRSPLSALNMILTQMDGLTEDKRILVRSSVNRINDIANSLLWQGRQRVQNKGAEGIEAEVTLLASLVDSLISEKRIQFRECPDVHLEVHLEEAYGLFANINGTEFKRVLSNLINNSVEALPQRTGRVDVIVQAKGKFVEIVIVDTGKGIPTIILEKLGELGVTHGKYGSDSGSGLGVYHARKTIQAFGGELRITNNVNQGASVCISLPQSEAPSWFVRRLNFSKGQIVVAVDDDSTILEIWRQRFAAARTCGYIELIPFSSGLNLHQWLIGNQEAVGKAIFLMDYELLGQQFNGLDLIEKFNLGSKSILVTSRFEEPELKGRCGNLGVSIIPKGMAPLVPIDFSESGTSNDAVAIEEKPIINRSGVVESDSKINTKSKINYDLCLIDDDQELVGAVWTAVATEKGLKIKLFSTPQAFIEEADSIDRLTPIYVDVSLGNGVSGLDVAHEVHKLGFIEVNLATGYRAESLCVPTFISRVVGKDFPLA